MILHELVSQIPLFQNYEKKNIFAYVKSRETKDYLKTRVRLFENQSGIKTVQEKMNF